MTTGLVKVRSHNVNGILNPIKREGMSWWGGRFEGSEFTLFNVYAPLGANWYFVRHTFNLMLTKAQGLMICGGDKCQTEQQVGLILGVQPSRQLT